MASPASAVPVIPVELQLAQPDGTTFAAQPFGDEWANGYETPDGYTIVRQAPGDTWYYASKGTSGELEPTGLRVGKDAPSVLKRHLRAATSTTLTRSTPVARVGVAPNRGNQPILVILVEFSDRASVGTTAATWNTSVFGTSGSVKHYYQEVSYGQLNLTPASESFGTANDGVVGWLNLGSSHPNTQGNTGVANQQLARNAILAADPYVNFASFDTDGNGYISSNELHVIVIVAGYETSYGGSGVACTPSVWGHSWGLGFNGVSSPSCDGKVVGDYIHSGGYAQFGEWHCATWDNPGHAATIGIICHELGHDLNWPDLYDTDESSAGVGKWSVMGAGNWLRTIGFSGSLPCHPDAFLKWYQGWVTPYQVTGAESGVSVGQAETNPRVIQLRDNSGGVDWVYGGHSGSGEYFLVENRQKTGYDAGLPGCGLLIWHIDESCSADNSANANENHRLVDLEQADGLAQLKTSTNDGDAGDPFPGTAGKTSFSGSTTPGSQLYSGAASLVSVSNIGTCGSATTADFSVIGGANIVPAGATLVGESCGSGNGVIDPQECVTLNIGLSNAGGAPTANLQAVLLASGGVDSPSAAQNYGAVPVGGAAVVRSFSFRANAACGGKLTLSLLLQDGTQSLGTVVFNMGVGSVGSQRTFSYSGPPVAIPDNTASGVNVPLVVSGLSGPVADLNFRIDGSSCSNVAGASTVGLDHSYVGDLVLKLTSPRGTSAVLISRAGGAGNNFCQTLLDDESLGGSISSVTSTDAPFSASYKPQNALSVFDGEDPNGTWTLNVSDNGQNDIGNVRAFSLLISSSVCCTAMTWSKDDLFSTGKIEVPGAASGWSAFGFNTSGFAYPDYSSSEGAYRGIVSPHPSAFRSTGVIANAVEWLPYSSVGKDNYVRAKYYMYAGGQASQASANTIPNLRLRLANRYAVNSMLEVLHHSNGDPGNAALATELRPSSDPANPSCYTIDFDPVDVPYLASNASSEGVLRGFESYSLDPQDTGYVAMTESQIGVYPCSTLPDSASALKVYAPSASDAGDLKIFNSATDLACNNLIQGTTQGAFAQADYQTSQPRYKEGTFGVTLESTAVPADRIGVLTREFYPGADPTKLVRVEEGKQYKIRFHVTSTQQSNLNAQLRLRARTIKFAWTHKYEIGGAWGTGATTLNQNNSIAQQALPGKGCLNPDKNATEDGGWYTLLFATPMQKAIRPEFATGVGLEVRMPGISAEAGPGSSLSSRRDLRLGADLVDTLSSGANAGLEKGSFTIDRIEVRSYPIVGE